MIYVPDLENYECYVVQSEGVIRGYEDGSDEVNSEVSDSKETATLEDIIGWIFFIY